MSNMPRVIFLLVFLFILPQIVVGKPSRRGVSTKEEPPSIAIRQGEVIVWTLPVPLGTQSVSGQFEKQSIQFFKNDSESPPSFTALIGIDFTHAVGAYPLDITIGGDFGERRLMHRIEVLSTDFGTQTLTLPKGKVDLDQKTLDRVEREAERFKEIFSRSAERKMWRLPFYLPTEGEISGPFGQRRVINGEEKNPHTGVDIAAPLGKEVIASNDGKIILTGEFFFNGNSIVIDHGGGVLTMYFHLSEIRVKEGMSVERGQIIGLVGQSGRATGPHLHWGARVHQARVDPYFLLKIGL